MFLGKYIWIFTFIICIPEVTVSFSVQTISKGQELNITCQKGEQVSNLSSVFKLYENITTVANILDCHFTTIPLEVCDLKHIETIQFNNNYLSSLAGNFTVWCANKLITVDLAHNRVNIIYSHYWKGFSKLRTLRLSWNNITYIEPESFLLPKLRVIYLDHNHLVNIDLWMWMMPAFLNEIYVRIYAEHNEISRFTNEIGFDLDIHYKKINKNMGCHIDLEYNKLRNFNSLFSLFKLSDIIYQLDKVVFGNNGFFMGHNPYACDCEAHFVMKLLNPFWETMNSGTDMKCETPERLNRQSLPYVKLTDYQCLTNDSLTPRCECVKTPENSTLRVTCKNSSSFPVLSKSYYNTYELYLSGNRIKEMKYKPYLPQTTILDLSYNNLKVINFKVITEYMKRLQILNIQDNSLQYIPKEIRTLSSSGSNLTDLKLSGNPISCDCHSYWLKSWIASGKHPIKDIDTVVCHSPTWNEGKLFGDVQLSDFVCYKPNIIVIGSVVSMLVFFLLIGSIVLYRKRHIVQFFIYTRLGWRFKKIDNFVDMKYDIFVSYSNLDEDKVSQIIKSLEEHNPPFRVALHYRDFIPGNAVAENIIQCIESSKCTLMIVSMNFVRSEWCCYEFKAAHHEAIKERKGNILLVLLEELDEKQLDADIKLYIKTHTYLELKHPQFTERLILALPKPCGRRNSIGLD